MFRTLSPETVSIEEELPRYRTGSRGGVLSNKTIILIFCNMDCGTYLSLFIDIEA
jgi:hypothetical protein